MINSFKTSGLVYHGEGAISKIKCILEELGLLVDPGLFSTGIIDELKKNITNDIEEFNEIEPEPSVNLVGKIVQILREKRLDAIISIGGGSCIDIGKMVSALMKNDGVVSDYFGVNKVKYPGLPLIVIPTTSGTGSEVSPAAIFHDMTDNTKKGVRSDFLYPNYVILDPVLTRTLPPALTASTGIDALTHAIEGFTSCNATIISDVFARKAIKMIGGNLKRAYRDGQDLDCREKMQMASYFAGITLAIANVGTVHALAQTIGGIYKISHGVANAFLLPHVMEFNVVDCVEEYCEIAKLLGVETAGSVRIDKAEKGIEAVRSLVNELNINESEELKRLKDADAGKIARLCMESQARLLKLNVRKTEEKDLKGIMLSALREIK
jgi:alcohol dehydrogenase class IV